MAKKKVFQISNALTEGLEETISAGQNYSGELRVDVIPIRKIDLDPDNPRELTLSMDDLRHGIIESDSQFLQKTKELDNLQSLAHSIREHGLINPIVVYKYGDVYRLIAGERRTLGSIIAGKSDIQARILESRPSPLKISLLQWIENVERSDLSLGERIKNLEKIVTVYAEKRHQRMDQVTVTELSNLLGCSKPHAMNYKAVLEADVSIKEAIFEDKVRNLEKAALIANISEQPLRIKALEACVNGAPLKKLKMIATLKKPARFVPMAARRGRQATAINFGITKNIKVAKLLFESIAKYVPADEVADPMIDWTDYQSISKKFHDLLKKLEEEYA